VLYYLDQISTKYEYLKKLLQGKGGKQKITWEDFDAMQFRSRIRDDILSHAKERQSDDLDLREVDAIEAE
jgi:hypothetical protein